MKKQILLLFLLLLTRATMGQEVYYNDYLITVSGGVYYGGDLSSGCGSRVDIYLEYENGDVVQIFGSEHGGGMLNFSKEVLFKSDNKIKQITTYARAYRQGNVTQSCGSRKLGEGNNYILLDADESYPCLDQTFTGKFSFYDEVNSTIRLQIFPISNKSLKMSVTSELVNNANQGLTLTSCASTYHGVTLNPSKSNFYYTLTAAMNDGSSETIFNGYLETFQSNQIISLAGQKNYPSPKRPLSFRLTSTSYSYVSAYYYSQTVCQTMYTNNVDNTFTVSNPSSSSGQTFSFQLYPSANSSNIVFKMERYSLPIKYVGSDNILPYDVANRVIILGPSGNPSSFYHWVFSTDGTTWNDLPARFQGLQQILVSGYDLLGTDFVNYHTKNIFFKLLIDCNGGESDILTLSARVSAPNIVSVTPIPDRCYATPNDGAVKIKFDRPLLTNGANSESLTILLTDPATPGVTIAQFANVSLDSDNSFESPRGLLSDKTYLIRLLGTYLGTATASDNAATQAAAFTTTRPSPVSSSLTAEPIHCYGGGDGKINITASGGAGGYSVEYTTPGQPASQLLSFGSSATAVLDLLTQGTYTLRVRDANGCNDQGGLKSMTITQPLTPLLVTYTAYSNPLAYGYTDGFVQTLLVGGTPYTDMHYNIEWYDPTNLLPPWLQSNAIGAQGYQANLTGVGDGSYLLKAYDSQYALAHPDHRAGCYAETSIFRLVQPTPLVVTVSESHYVTCAGNSDGVLQASAQGGIPIPNTLYRYEWFAEANGTLQAINQTDRTATGLKAGLYRVKITDNNNIEKLSDAFTLVQPDVLQAQVATTPVHCYGGSDGTATATVQGGTSPYAYEWLDGSTTAQLSGLSADTYFLMVTDVRGCTASTSAAVATPQPVSSTLTAEAVHCYAGGDGKITLAASGGVGGYYFDYAPAGSQVFTTVVAFASAASHTVDFLRQGTYTVLVHDGNHCNDAGGIKSIVVSQPSQALRLSQSATTNPRAYGYTDGFIETTIVGATPYADKHYTVEWYDHANLMPAALQNNTAQADGYHANINGLGDGSYIVKVYDSQYALAHPDHRAGCFVQSNIFVLVQPPPLVVTISEQHIVTCNGYANGQLQATAQGGIPLPGATPYYYEWLLADNTGTYHAIGQTSNTASELKSGLYKIKITDGNNIDKVSEAFLLDQPRNPITSTITTEAVHCNGGGDGKIHLVVRGGVGNYSFEYFTPGSTDPTLISLNTDTTAVIDFLPAGTYKIYVHDANACNDAASIKSITVTQPDSALSIRQATTTNPLAYGYTDGFIETTLTGGTPFADSRYTVEWYDPLNVLPASLQQNNAVAAGYQANIIGLGDGYYKLKAYDSQYELAHPNHRAGCYAERDSLRLIQPPPLVVTVTEHHFVSCKGYADGALTAHAQGGIPLSGGLPYQYEWLVVDAGTPRPVNQTDSIATQLKSGVYIIKITDKNKIAKSSTPFTLVEPNTLQAKVVTTPVSCESGEDGTATPLVEGGTVPYTYQWSEGSTTASISGLFESKYFVFVKDIRGCTTTASARVTSPYALTIDSVLQNPQCYGYSNGSIDLTVKEGSAPYRYLWSTGAQTEDIAGLPAGSYRVLITDNNNCKSYRAYQLQDPEPIRIELGPERYLCNGQDYTANASLSDAGTLYQWTGPSGFTASTAKVVLTQEGTYRVDVTDSNGCKGGDDLSIKRVGTDINSEFIVSTQAFVQSEVTLINISTPAPDSVHWYANADAANFVSSQPGKAIVTFAQEGTYTLYLKAYRQRCEAVFTKVITVLGTSFEVTAQATPPFIETFAASPVPTAGSFTVTVSLQEASTIRLRLISVATNTVVSDRQEQGSTTYEIPYNLNLAAGTYMLLLESRKANSLLKIVVY